MASALITGASSGIGKELARLFAERKYDLILLSRSEDKLKNIKKELEEKYLINCELVVFDLSNTNNIKDFEAIIKNFDCEILINCAGFGEIKKFDDLSIERELSMLNVNLLSPIILTRLFLEKNIKNQDNINREITIINICSTAALYLHPYMTMYSTTKRGLLNYSLSLSEELKNRNKNIHLLSICPGPTATPFFEESTKEKFGSFKLWEMSTEVVAKEIINCFDKKKRFGIIGFRNKILAKFVAMLPINFQLKMVAKHLKNAVK